MKIVFGIAAVLVASMPGNSVAVNLVATNLEEQTSLSSLMGAIRSKRMAQTHLASSDTTAHTSLITKPAQVKIVSDSAAEP